MDHFGEYVRRLLDARGWTISHWARMVGIAQGFASNVVSGRRTPPLDAIDLWADSFALTGDERLRFIDLAAVSHLPKRSQARFLAVIDEQARMKAELAGYGRS
jgi:transcriptional regulator with XRE-family HTH domain